MNLLQTCLVAICTLATSIAWAGSLNHYVCIDAQGNKSIQDTPCINDEVTAFSRTIPGTKQNIQSAPLNKAPVAVQPTADFSTEKPITLSPTPVATHSPPSHQNTFQPLIDTVWRWAVAMMAIACFIVLVRVATKRTDRWNKNSPIRGRYRDDANQRRSEDLWKHTAPEPSALDTFPIRPDPVSTKPSQWSLALLREIEWKRFEELCAGVWRLKGYPATLTCTGADGGVDVVISDRMDAKKAFAIIQCKALSSAVGVEKVRALWGAKDHFKAQLAIFYGLSGFTDDAVRFAEGKHLKLVSGEELLKQVLELPAETQQKFLAEITRGDYTTPSCAKCDIKMVRRQGKSGHSDFWGCQNYPRCRNTLR